MKSLGGMVSISRAQWLRRLAQRRNDRVAFVFSGGSTLSALQVGALKALFERDITPDLAIGTSAGSINAAFVAFDPSPRGVAQLEKVWLGLREDELFPGARFRTSWARLLVRGNRVFDNSGLERVIRTRFGTLEFEDAEIPLAVVAADLMTGAERVFSTGELVKPILASSALPGIYPPVRIEGRDYFDGGVVNNVPVEPAVAMGAGTIYVLNSSSTATKQRRPLARPIDYMLHASSLARGQRFRIERPYLERRRVRVVDIPPVELDFFVQFGSLEHTRRLIDLAQARTAEFLALERPALEATADEDKGLVPTK